MKNRFFAFTFSAIAAVVCIYSHTIYAQSLPGIIAHREPDALPQIMVLGTTHFANPGQDNINFDVNDILSDRQQEGIADLIEVLVEFNPTHIAVEVQPHRQTQLDEKYQGYLDGSAELSRSEHEQIGMRLAKALGHAGIYAVDWQGEPPGGFTSDFDWHTYAQENGFDEQLAAVSDPSLFAPYAEQGDRTIIQWLANLNTDESRLAFHKSYFDIALIGTHDNAPGANWVGSWYTRNLKIFNNIVRLAQNENDRVLVIYGVGHAHLLRQFAIESGAFEVVDLNDYL